MIIQYAELEHVPIARLDRHEQVRAVNVASPTGTATTHARQSATLTF